MTLFAVLLIFGGVLFVAKMMWRLGATKDEQWTDDDQGAYEVLCDWERES